MHFFRAQGATEYLVLLAVVLIVALVSVALLGFFPGMASDAQITQSQAYWRSATPIAIMDGGARVYTSNGITYPFFLLRNTGVYPIRITGIIGGDGGKANQYYDSNDSGCGSPAGAPGSLNISSYYYLAPGEEKYVGHGWWFGLLCRRSIYSSTGGSATAYVGGASSVCQNSSTTPGTLDYKSLGFEYVVYMEGQEITKRQIGKDFVVKCLPPV